MRARVLVRPKAGILDPQGQAVERALPALGFEGVRNVHVGRMIELDVEDPDRLPEMCERLLTNPLIEDWEIEEAELEEAELEEAELEEKELEEKETEEARLEEPGIEDIEIDEAELGGEG